MLIALAETINSTANSQDKKSDAAQPSIVTTSPKQLAANGFADIVEELLPSVVNISAVQEMSASETSVDQVFFNELPKSPLFEDFRKQLENQLKNSVQGNRKKISSIGSGFIISKDGLIVTNNHVIEDATEINVNLYDGSKYKAKIVGRDKRSDIAILKINPNKDLKFVKFADSSKIRIGDWIIVVGNPYGLGGSVSVGIISARSRSIGGSSNDEFIQTDAAINKGNSGGPMFNIKGEVVGISSAIFSPSGGSVGIGFATPSNSASQIVKQLREQGEVMRGWIGVSVQDISDDIAESMKINKVKGAFVSEVLKNGPADKAGILPTDIVLKVDDQEIEEVKALPRIINNYPIDKMAKITILRNGKAKVILVKVEKMKEEGVKKSKNQSIEKMQNIKPAGHILGMNLGEFKSIVKKNKAESKIEGLVVMEVNQKSEASEKGIMSGDVILSANQTPVPSVEKLKQIIEDASKGNKKLFLFIRRDEANYAVILPLR